MKKAAVFIFTLMCVAYAPRQSTYPRVMEIDRIEDDKAYCIDAVGFEWSFAEPEDLEPGDLIICTMYDNGTTETIADDEIVDVTWSGYWVVCGELYSATN